MQSVLDGSVDGRSRNFPLGVDGFAFEDLVDADGLVALLASFESELEVTDSALFQRYAEYRDSGGETLDEGGVAVRTLTPASPLGRVLCGRYIDDPVELDRPGHRLAAVIDWIR